jgi:hypothetical protein
MNYHQLILLMIEELLEEAERDITRFNYSHLDYENFNLNRGYFKHFYDSASTKYSEGYVRSIIWENRQKDHLYLSMNLTEGSMLIEMPNGIDSINLPIGRGREHPELKKKFTRLFKLVVNYVDVQLKEEKLAAFYDSVRMNFPSIEDRFILETFDDKK